MATKKVNDTAQTSAAQEQEKELKAQDTQTKEKTAAAKKPARSTKAAKAPKAPEEQAVRATARKQQSRILALCLCIKCLLLFLYVIFQDMDLFEREMML